MLLVDGWWVEWVYRSFIAYAFHFAKGNRSILRAAVKRDEARILLAYRPDA
jgi:hypothetical protein